MTRPGIEPRSPRPLANTLTNMPMSGKRTKINPNPLKESVPVCVYTSKSICIQTYILRYKKKITLTRGHHGQSTAIGHTQTNLELNRLLIDRDSIECMCTQRKEKHIH